ncbi:MAG: glycosyltransferase [Chloroflexia bacterium]|nr:glycosyltransferase [Chloroflexia bacterium]
MIVPSIGDDLDVSTPIVNTFVAHLGQKVRLHVFPMEYPTGGGVISLGSATIHSTNGPDPRLRRLVASTLSKIYHEHRTTRFDLIHGLWLFPPGAIAVLAGRLLGIPSVVSVGGAEVVSIPDICYGGLLSRRGRAVQRQVLWRASAVTGGSGYILDLARAVTRRPSGYELVPLPVDPMFRPLADRPLLPNAEQPRLLHAASLIPVKDQATLLRAFALLLEALPGATLDIAGEDPFGHRSVLEKLAVELAVADRVRFLGRVPHAEMLSHYQQADLFLLSSRHESQAMVVLEAAACGLPTVGAAVGVVRDLAPESAIAVSPRDPGAIADAALNLLSDPERLQRMRISALAQVDRHYATGPVTDRFVRLYTALLAGRS